MSDLLFRNKYKALWSPWRDGVTQSLLRLFLQCREQCRLRYVEGWESRHSSDAKQFGNIAHHVLDVCYRNAKGKIPNPASVKSAVKDYLGGWKKEVKKPTTQQLEQMEKLAGMAELLMPRYFTRWQGDFTKKYPLGAPSIVPRRLLATESEFSVVWQFKDGATMRLRGKIDGEFEDARGGLWLRENKFKGQIDDAKVIDSLTFDFQVFFYLWARVRAGLKPRGVLYDVTRRPGQRWLQDDDLHSFLARVEKDVGDSKRAAHYFHRYEVAVTVAEIEAWEKQTLAPILLDLRAWWDGRAPHYGNPDALETKYGRADLYAPIVHGDFSDCYRRTRPFSELMGDL